MNVGEYVRTEEGLIAKYIGINKKYKWHLFDGNIQWYYEYYRQEIDFEDWKEFIEEDIIKSSSNIIDLIEVGDYVNGKRVNFVYSPDGKQVFRIELDVDGLKGHMICESEHIKSIVTKEQFSQMEYKVGE